MPSGPKKRRAAKRKNQEKIKAKQTDELTKVSVVKLNIPIEKLAKGAVWHDETSVDKKMDKTKNKIGDFSDEFAQSKQTDVSVKLAKGADLNEVKITSEEVSDNSNAIKENNEVPLLDVTSNEDIIVSNDEHVLSKNDGSIMESVESGEILQGNECCGVETEQLSSAPEQMFDLLSDDMTPEKMLERDVPVVVPVEAIEVEVSAENEAATVGKMENVNEANDESLLNVTTNEDKEMYKDVIEANEESQSSSCIVESIESVVVPELKDDTAPLVSMNVVSNESINEADDASMIHDQSTEVVLGMKDAAQQVSDVDTVFILPKVGLPAVLGQTSTNDLLTENAAADENIGCFSADISSDSKEMQGFPTGTVSSSTENQVTEIPLNSKEMQAVPEGTVSPSIENQVYFACPMHCNTECSFSQLLSGQLMDNVVELKSVIHSLKEDLVKALNKLDSISY